MSKRSPGATRGLRHAALADASGFGLHRLRSTSGLSISLLPSGCIHAIECGDILINQVLGSPVAAGIHRLYLRVHDGQRLRFIEIVGPGATSDLRWADDRVVWNGAWRGLDYRCTCWLHPNSAVWFFHVEIENRLDELIACDAVGVQDVGLATRGQVRNNELFTSQYLDHAGIEHPDAGVVVLTRQNLPQPGKTHPWLLQGCSPGAVGFTTDGLDFFGTSHRGGASPAALSRPIIGHRVRQFETGYLAIQSSQIALKPSSRHAWTFFAQFVADHPEPSSPCDQDRIEEILRMRDDLMRVLKPPPQWVTPPSSRTVFQSCQIFPAEALSEHEIAATFPDPRRHEEFASGQLLSFFAGDDSRHVVLLAKELSVARPAAHILRAGRGLMPVAPVLSCTCYASGGFASQLTLGNTSLGMLLSRVRDPLNVVCSSGLRVFVRDDSSKAWQLLGAPSAFEMALDQCRWHYKRGGAILTVSCIVSDDEPAISYDVYTQGAPMQLLIVGEIAAGPSEYDTRPSLDIDELNKRITIRPDPSSLLAGKLPGLVFHIVMSTPEVVDRIGGDELLRDGGEPLNLPYFAVRTRATTRFRWTIRGSFSDDASPEKHETTDALSWRESSQVSRFWSTMTAGVRVRSTESEPAAQLHDTLAWFARDAVIHLGTPRGVEQPNGGAWGVRDVCQGSIEFLLSYDHCETVAEVIRTVFAQQFHRRGDWPQWFMFPPFQDIQARQCHGDVPIWPLKALCDYLEHTDDGAMLEQRVAYTDDETLQRTHTTEPIVQHTDRLLETLGAQFLAGVALPRYGEGDWDDSLQPAETMLRDRMVSSWTAALLYQTLRRFSFALARFGQSERAARAGRMADDLAADFRRHLLPDGVVAGFAVFDAQPARPVEYLLHPRDTRTGLKYRLIPMTRGILSGIFSPEQARRHLDLITEHLLFPDGARLMDRPTRYDGGRESTFRRSESAAFFGREIGLQYVHAHLRYAEALAMMGRADELWRALRVVNPIAVTQLVPNSRARQRNCYFSSSDAAFDTRYDACRDYEKLRRGEVPTDGGWRIYSSGPGIYTNLVIRHLFGLRRHYEWYEFDPVLPRELDGVSCELDHGGRRVQYRFFVEQGGCGVKRIVVNEQPLSEVTPIPNPYRGGGVRVKREFLDQLLRVGANVVDVYL